MENYPFTFQKHVYVPGLNLWLDSTSSSDFGYVSHAHGDHMGRHRRVLSTPATWELFCLRLAKGRSLAQHAAPQTVAYNEAFAAGDHQLTLFSAGHVLGSSQLRIVFPEGHTLGYTGDFKLRADGMLPPAEPLVCDDLIMETTFGTPSSLFPPLEEAQEALFALLDRWLTDGDRVCVVAYALGKAQQASRALALRGYTVVVHPQIVPIHQLYERHGVSLGRWSALEPNSPIDAVRIMPPEVVVQNKARFAAADRPRTVFLSGWGLDPSAKYRYGVDEVIPWSDHADWAELVEYVARANPQRVFTLHGSPRFASHLRSQGIYARHLPTHQQTLFDG